jgi:hypothetical protein
MDGGIAALPGLAVTERQHQIVHVVEPGVNVVIFFDPINFVQNGLTLVCYR